MKPKQRACTQVAAAVGAVLLIPSLAWAQDVGVESPATPKVGYKSGFFIESADGGYSAKIQGRVQGRFEFESAEEVNDAGEEDRCELYNFAVQRARFALSGKAIQKQIGYKFQADFGRGSVSLKDFYFDYQLGGSPMRIRVGQWKKPFSRQQITSSGRQEFVDRAATDSFFRAGRDVGLGVHNNYEKSPEIEWAVGVFNGDGEGSNPDKFAPVVAARVGFNQGGIKGYSEADLEGGPLRFGIGASVQSEFDLDGDNTSGVRAGVDFIAKMNGMAASGGVYVSTAQEAVADGEDIDFVDQEYEALGFHAQAGTMLTDTMQVAVRYTLINPDAGDMMQDITLGVSAYSLAHNLKWQNDVTVHLVEGGDFGDEVMGRSQLQLSF